MNRTVRYAAISLLLLLASSVPGALAQQPAGAELQGPTGPVPVPRLVKFSGTLVDAQERPLTGPVGVTFALYAQQTGGAALWLETQNVKPDGAGNYTVLLGANSANGVPAELFVSGEARWLGIQMGQQPEHERILLVSVPYALKAGDAETLGGLPASAFVTTNASGNTANSGGAAPASSSSATPGAPPKSGTAAVPKNGATTQAACASVTSDGNAAVNSIALFSTACNVQSSLMTQASINGFPGVNLAGNNAGLLLSGTGTHQVTVTGATSGRLGQDAGGFFFTSDTNGSNVRFLTNNGTLNERMRINSAGNVGIGTAAPATALHVSSGADTEVSVDSTATGGHRWTMQSSATQGLAGVFQIIDRSLGASRVSINTAGNVGIGTSTPSHKVEIMDTGNSGLRVQTNTTGGTVASFGGSGGFQIDAPNVPGGRFVVTQGGNVGIGTTTPAALLDVNGAFHVGTGNSRFRVEGPASGTANPVLASWGGAGDFAIDAPGIGAGRFVVKDSGSVGIGTATPATALHVSGSGDTEVSVQSTATGGRRWTIQSSATGNLAGVFQIIDRTAGASRLSVSTAGHVGIGTTTPGATLEVVAGGTTLADAWTVRSSRRWKSNIHPLVGALETVQRLRGVSYNQASDGKHQIGVIAEEVGKVLPEIVTYEKNGVDAQGVDYARLTALLIEATKEQQREIQRLTGEVRKLRKAQQAMTQLQARQARLESQQRATATPVSSTRAGNRSTYSNTNQGR